MQEYICHSDSVTFSEECSTPTPPLFQYCNKGGKFCDFFAAPECNTDADCGAKAKKLKLPCCASFSKIAPCTLMGKATLSACADTNCIDVTPSLSGASSLSFGTAFPALVATLSTLALAVLA